MTADDAFKRVQPLTHVRKGGGLYQRDPAVEAEIASVLQAPPESLTVRARIGERESPDFLREETLVYYIRVYHAIGKQAIVTKLTEALLARCARWITRRLRALGLRQQDAEEAYSEIVRVVITAITDMESDRGDFYQVRFARALKLKVLNAYDKQLREVERGQQQVRFTPGSASTVEEIEEGEIERGRFRAEVAEPSQADDEMFNGEDRAERRALLDAVLGSIRNPRHREAFVLHRAEGWQITANDPNEPCLVRYFQVKSAKTIYNWIRQAEADIAAAGFAAWREEER